MAGRSKAVSSQQSAVSSQQKAESRRQKAEGSARLGSGSFVIFREVSWIVDQALSIHELARKYTKDTKLEFEVLSLELEVLKLEFE